MQGHPHVGVSLSELFPLLKREENAWSRVGTEFARVAEQVPLSAAVAAAQKPTERRVSWSDSPDPVDAAQADWDP